MRVEPSREELEAMRCWEADDRVPGRPQMTAFRRTVRLHQARWREAAGHPIGSQPLVPRAGKPTRPVGSRLPLEYALETGANFLTPGAREAARARMSFVEPHQTLDRQRLWADLLWSPALAFNLFGDVAACADDVVRTLARDAAGTVSEIRFAHSPGRLDRAYLNSLRAFDAAFVLDGEDGTRGIVAVDVQYHGWAKPETPKPENRARNLEVARRSRAFREDATDALEKRSPLALTWLEHLLLLSMLQHEGDGWAWGRYVAVHPEENTDAADTCAAYRALLADTSTFASVTLEELLDSRALPAATANAVRSRYVPE